MESTLRPFHLAIPVTNINLAESWYTDKFGCSVGRKNNSWIDFNFFGHQLVAHLVPEINFADKTNLVDNELIPSRHFGIIMEVPKWENLIKKLQVKKIKFIIEPQVRFKEKSGEQSTFFIMDPFGNALEFKAFKKDSQIFAC